MADNADVYKAVQEHYGAIATSKSSGCCGPSTDDSGCGCNTTLYDQAMLEGLPVDVTGLSLGCGDPVTLASLKLGEVVLDLGSGGGIDCFMAARQVGPEGRVIGVDMTPAMLAKARSNAQKLHMDTSRVEFREGQIEDLPVEDSTVDVIMSNCVINLSPDKPAVFREAFRVLKPGGRIAVSDIVTTGDLSPALRANLEQWAACVSGAIDMRVYADLMRQAGFIDVEVVDKAAAATLLGLPGGIAPRIVSARITARKPATGEQVGGSAGSKDYFDAIADQWDGMQQSFFSDDVRDAALARAGVQPGQLAADIGAGSGFVTTGLIDQGLRVIAVDQSAEMLKQMQRKLGEDSAVEYRQGEAEALPIEAATVDHAFANMYLHHVEDPAHAIQEMVRIVKPGGKLVITDLDRHGFEFLRAEHHDRWMGFRRDDVRRWFEAAGLSNVQVGGVGSDCCAESTCGCGSAAISIFIASGEKV